MVARGDTLEDLVHVDCTAGIVEGALLAKRHLTAEGHALLERVVPCEVYPSNARRVLMMVFALEPKSSRTTSRSSWSAARSRAVGARVSSSLLSSCSWATGTAIDPPRPRPRPP